MNYISCNCPECVWNRIVLNQGENIFTKINKRLSYKIENDVLTWIPHEPTHNNLYKQSKSEILKCISNRKNEDNPSTYPGTATSETVKIFV